LSENAVGVRVSWVFVSPATDERERLRTRRGVEFARVSTFAGLTFRRRTGSQWRPRSRGNRSGPFGEVPRQPSSPLIARGLMFLAGPSPRPWKNRRPTGPSMIVFTWIVQAGRLKNRTAAGRESETFTRAPTRRDRLPQPSGSAGRPDPSGRVLVAGVEAREVPPCGGRRADQRVGPRLMTSSPPAGRWGRPRVVDAFHDRVAPRNRGDGRGGRCARGSVAAAVVSCRRRRCRS